MDAVTLSAALVHYIIACHSVSATHMLARHLRDMRHASLSLQHVCQEQVYKQVVREIVGIPPCSQTPISILDKTAQV